MTEQGTRRGTGVATSPALLSAEPKNIDNLPANERSGVTELAANERNGVIDLPANEPAPTPASTTDPTSLAHDVTTMSAFQRWRRAFTALANVVVDPEKTEQVLVFSIYANAGSMPKRIHRFFESEAGRRLYAEHRTIDSLSIDLETLAALPHDTLGFAYAYFLRSRGLTPAVFDKPPTEVSDPRMQYVVQRLRQTHDLWHVVTGLDTNPASEVALQAFTFAQVRAPSSAILAAVGTLRGLREKPSLARHVLASLWTGVRAERLPVFAWEDHWATPLREVRQLLGIPVDGIGIP